MDYEAQLKLQAYLDGELPEAEARHVADWLAQDAEAAALLAELSQTHEALAGFERDVRLPESRDFYWSKIRREIQRSERPARAPLIAPWLRWLVPATAGALVAVAVLRGHSDVPTTEVADRDTSAFTYRDYDTGATLIWLSFPSENEVAENDEDDLL
jgi:anti-sigma factor RsiW